MKTLNPLTVLLALCCMVPALQSTAHAQSVDGYNVRMVEFGTDDGILLGTILQTTPENWVVQNERGQEIFALREIGRDARGVSMRDAADNVAVQLDLHANLVLYSDRKIPEPQPLYTVFRASATLVDGLAARTDDGHDPN